MPRQALRLPGQRATKMTTDPANGLALSDLRLLTRLADYALPEAGQRLVAAANACFARAGIGEKLCSGGRLSLYMTCCGDDKDYSNLAKVGDFNPHYSLGSLHKQAFRFDVARKTLDALNNLHGAALAETFIYAHQYARQWSSEDDRIVSDADKWLTQSGPALLKRLPHRSQEPDSPEQEEFARTLHHHLVALCSRVPIPGFLSTDLHNGFFVERTQRDLSSHFRATFIEMQPGGAPDLSYKPSWFTADGTVYTENELRRQTIPNKQQNPFFAEIKTFILYYLAGVFNPGFDGLTPTDSESHQAQSYLFLLAFPIFFRQSVVKDGAWRREGSFLGWVFLSLYDKPEDVQRLLTECSALLEPLNALANCVQEAREQEFWRHRIPSGLDQNSLARILRRYAVEFCGAVPEPVTVKSPTAITADTSKSWLEQNPDIVPPFTWPTSGHQEGLPAETWKLSWLKTTLFEGGKEFQKEASRASLLRFQDAALRLKEIQASQHAASLRGRAEVSHDFSFTIRTALSGLRGLAADIESLRQCMKRFPIQSFTQLPSSIQSFVYPAQLYAIALSSACKYERDDQNFLRQLPRVSWIEETLDNQGFGKSLIDQLATHIAKPLAKGSLDQFDQDSTKLTKVEPQTTGCISAKRMKELGRLEASIVVGVISELLREAFQHCCDEHPVVCVTLSEVPQVKLVIENSSPTGEYEAKAANGNQSSTLHSLMSRLPRWKLTLPRSIDGIWVRELIHKAATTE